MRPVYMKSDGQVDVAKLRRFVGKWVGNESISQGRFAMMMGVSYRAVQEWEQGRRTPSGPAHALLLVIGRYPELVKEVIDEDFRKSIRLSMEAWRAAARHNKT